MSDLKAKFKPKDPSHVLPKEAYIAGEEYAITINPVPFDFDAFNFEERDKLDREAILNMRQSIVKLIAQSCITLYVEFSKKGRLHFHGIFTVKEGQECNFKRFTIPALMSLGQICIKHIEDRKQFDDNDYEDSDKCEAQYATWLEYCTKESNQVEAAGLPTSINNLPIMAGGSAANIISKVKKERPHKREIINN